MLFWSPRFGFGAIASGLQPGNTELTRRLRSIGMFVQHFRHSSCKVTPLAGSIPGILGGDCGERSEQNTIDPILAGSLFAGLYSPRLPSYKSSSGFRSSQRIQAWSHLRNSLSREKRPWLQLLVSIERDVVSPLRLRADRKRGQGPERAGWLRQCDHGGPSDTIRIPPYLPAHDLSHTIIIASPLFGRYMRG